MKNPRISVITPVWVGGGDNEERRLRLFRECIESVKNQTFKGKFEHIIVNDGSPVSFTIPHYPHIRIIDQDNMQRMEAFNHGLREAKGEIICFLDSDDSYEPTYLEEVDKLYHKYPKYKMFNFGNTYVYPDGTTSQRDCFSPKKRKVGHEVFSGGNIVNGTFVFHRSVYDALGAFPPPELKNVDCTKLNYPQYSDQPEPFIRDLNTASPYDFSAAAQIEFPEIQKYYMVKHPDHPKLLVRELGNPFGQDYYLFYKYTRKYHSKPIKGKYLLKVNLKI